MFGEGRRDRVCAVMANLMDLESLCSAFEGCVAVFHTSAFTDPSGVSGYTVSIINHMKYTYWYLIMRGRKMKYQLSCCNVLTVFIDFFFNIFVFKNDR